MSPPNKNSCVRCARRKSKCDKASPCSGCSKAQVACLYRAPVPSQRHRRRLTQRDLLSKIQELETLLQNNSIPFDPLGNSWIHSPWEDKLGHSPSAQTSPESSAETAIEAEVQPMAYIPESQSADTASSDKDGAARLWSDLSEDVRSSWLDFWIPTKKLQS